MPKTKRSKKSSGIKPVIIVCISLLTLSVAGIGGYLYLKNYSEQKMKQGITPAPSFYKLPESYTNEDLFKSYAKIRKDKEYRVYFNVLTKQQAQEAFVTVTKILNEQRNKEGLRSEIDKAFEEVQTLSEAFYYLDFDNDFILRPQNYPKLNQILSEFLVSEFELTLLGAFYKANYDPQFMFSWKNLHIASARKMLGILSKIKQAGTK